jgi:hypothetical protein
MVRVKRSSVKPVESSPAPALKEKPRCESCGVRIPTARQRICSYCKGDPFHGSDGYLVDMIKELLDNPHCPEARKVQLRQLLEPKISTHPMRLRMVNDAVDGAGPLGARE